MRYQPIYDIAALCVLKNIKQVVLCPGSRCAPLTLAFTRHPDIKVRTFSDERSAGFVALGMAQATRTPVLVVCTSGTAAYNLAPAVAEACFSETPLIIFTADRPAEWIGQHDGQTVFQDEIFGRHVKKFFQLPQDYDHKDSLWAINRMVNEALNLSAQFPRGPVHVNAPFREPLYPEMDETISYSADIRVIKENTGSRELTENQKEKIAGAWSQFDNILVVAGQHSGSAALTSAVSAVAEQQQVPVVHDIISNLHDGGNTIQHADLFLGEASDELKESLRPDLLITFGNSLISKNVKLFLRKYSAREHWHIQPGGLAADTFKQVTEVFHCDPLGFFHHAGTINRSKTFSRQKQQNFFHLWEAEERRTTRTLNDFFTGQQLTELEVVNSLLRSLPANSNLHLANSMSVRYANCIGLHAAEKGIQVFSNRGTSGIDGCTSTAVGHCLMEERPNFLITGDMAFFYDRNAFWHNYSLPNLRVLVLNNHGGLIFDVLDGPSSLPEAGEYFITRQALNGKKLCEEYGFDYLKIDNPRKIKNVLKDFVTFDGKTKIMEIEGDTATNKHAFEVFKSKINKRYEL
jgi:2-succinyl-5-enolpyruvyl-6-hydroxy-3-cyclohexene-1-carboxylate synthase